LAQGTAKLSVLTKAGAARVITVTLAISGHSVKASGTAGTTSAYNTAVTVVLCKDNFAVPCASNRIAATLTATAGATTPSYTTGSSGNLNGVQVYGRATQSETS